MSSLRLPKRSFAIIGHPVGHSLSPSLYTIAFQSCGLPYSYERLDVHPDDLAKVIGTFRNGFSGFNITIPHKSTTIPLLDSLSPSAQFIGAVNTVIVSDGKLHGENTDVEGVVESLRPFREELRGGEALLLGAGGAARAVLFALAREMQMKSVTIFTRRVEQAMALAREFDRGGMSVEAQKFEPAEIQSAMDHSVLVINSTPVGMHPHREMSPIPDGIEFTRGQIVFDLIYRPIQTRLLRTAQHAGCRTIGGLEMLIQQGAIAFRHFTGLVMPIAHVREHLQRLLEAEHSTNR